MQYNMRLVCHAHKYDHVTHLYSGTCTVHRSVVLAKCSSRPVPGGASRRQTIDIASKLSSVVESILYDVSDVTIDYIFIFMNHDRHKYQINNKNIKLMMCRLQNGDINHRIQVIE